MRNQLSLYEICNDCGSRCCTEPGPPIVFQREIQKIRNYCEANGLRDYLVPIEEENGRLFTIPRGEDGCPYVNSEGSCDIQEVKPTDCRIYPHEPIEIEGEMVLGVSASCPAKHLLDGSFSREAEGLFSTLSRQDIRDLEKYTGLEGYDIRREPSDFGLELALDLWGCNPLVLRSREKIIEYNQRIVSLIGMEPVGDPIIPKKFGNGTLYGFSSIQFIQTSSIVTHIAEKMLEAHVNIFSCKDFDTEEATEFTKDFFKARKTRSRVLRR